MLKQQGGKCTYLRAGGGLKSLRNSLTLLLSQDLQLGCKLWAGEPLHHSYAKVLLPLTAPVRDHQCSQQSGQLTSHIQTHTGTQRCAPAVLYWTKAYAGTGCPTTCTHSVGTRNPSGTWYLTETALRCPGQASWDRESHCHLVGKGRIASALLSGRAGSKPPLCKTPGRAGEQDPEKPQSTWLGGRREAHTQQS